MTYATVEDNKVIKTGPRPTWRIGDSLETSRPLTDSELIERGRYPVQPAPAYDPLTQKLTPIPMDQWSVNAADVGPTFVVVALSPEEIEAKKAADRDAVWEQIKHLRDQKTQTGGYQVGGYWFHSDVFSRSQQQGLARMADQVQAAGGDMDQQFVISGNQVDWKTMSGVFVPMTPNLAQSIFSAAAIQDAAHYAHAETLNAQMRAATAPYSIDITAGWPAVYGDS